MEEINPVATNVVTSNAPLKDIEEWDDFLTGRYHEGKSEAEFRQYDEKATPGVAEFYRLNHQFQTFDYVMQKESEYFGLNKGEKSIWEAADFLNTLVADSDPDKDLTQIEHLMQTSEFNVYDLYSKGHTKPNVKEPKPNYDDLFGGSSSRQRLR